MFKNFIAVDGIKEVICKRHFLFTGINQKNIVKSISFCFFYNILACIGAVNIIASQPEFPEQLAGSKSYFDNG